MKTLLLALALSVSTPAQSRISVTYRIINLETTPESMSALSVGLLVFVKTDDPAVGKVDVQIAYFDSTGERRIAEQTVNRRVTRAGYDAFAMPVLFRIQIQSLIGITAYGFASTPTVGEAVFSGNKSVSP